MKTELIKALKETVLDLRFNRKEYGWHDSEMCNCGILAQNIIGCDRSGLRDRLYGDGGFAGWGNVCRITGKSLMEVLHKMKSVGLSDSDIENFELLGDVIVCKEAGLEEPYKSSVDGKLQLSGFSEKGNVIKYIEAWIRILEREEIVPEIEQINAAPNKPMKFVSYEEMKTKMELLFQN